MKLQKEIVGLSGYYSEWIPNFSEKIKPISSNTSFPIPQPVIEAFNSLKQEIEIVAGTDESKSFVVEADASDVAIAVAIFLLGQVVKVTIFVIK